MEQEKLVELTADIVAAHVANNTVSVGDCRRSSSASMKR